MPLEHAPDWRTSPPHGVDRVIWCGAVARAKNAHPNDPYPSTHDVYEATVIVRAVRDMLFRERPVPAICRPDPVIGRPKPDYTV